MLQAELTAMTACWSAKGKQLVVGTPSGKLVQYTPEGEAKAEIPSPLELDPPAQYYPSFVRWLENDIFLVAYAQVHGSPDEPLEVFVIHRQGAAFTFTKFFDPLNAMGVPGRSGRFRHFAGLRDWGSKTKHLDFLMSGVASEVGVMHGQTAAKGEAPKWEALILEETARGIMPAAKKGISDDTSCIGLAVDLTSDKAIRQGLQGGIELPDLDPAPRLLAYSQEGVIISFNILYADAGRYEGMVKYGEVADARPTEGSMNATDSVSAIPTTSAEAPKPKLEAPKPSFGFGAFGSPASTSTPSKPGTAFGGPAFGASTSPSSGSLSQPVPSSALAIGQAPATKPTTLNSVASGPSIGGGDPTAFGQSAIGQSSNSAFGHASFGSTISAFGSPSSGSGAAAFGSSAFGQTVKAAMPSAFGSSSISSTGLGFGAFGSKPAAANGFAFGTSTFGTAPTAPGSNATPMAFASMTSPQPSVPTSNTPAFGQAPSLKPASPGATAFGRQSVPVAFGQTAKPAGQSATFGNITGGFGSFAPKSAPASGDAVQNPRAFGGFGGFAAAGGSAFGDPKADNAFSSMLSGSAPPETLSLKSSFATSIAPSPSVKSSNDPVSTAPPTQKPSTVATDAEPTPPIPAYNIVENLKAVKLPNAPEPVVEPSKASTSPFRSDDMATVKIVPIPDDEPDVEKPEFEGDEDEGGSEAEVSADESDDSEEDNSDQNEHEEANDDDKSNEKNHKADRRRRSTSSAPQMSPTAFASMTFSQPSVPSWSTPAFGQVPSPKPAGPGATAFGQSSVPVAFGQTAKPSATFGNITGGFGSFAPQSAPASGEAVQNPRAFGGFGGFAAAGGSAFKDSKADNAFSSMLSGSAPPETLATKSSFATSIAPSPSIKPSHDPVSIAPPTEKPSTVSMDAEPTPPIPDYNIVKKPQAVEFPNAPEPVVEPPKASTSPFRSDDMATVKIVPIPDDEPEVEDSELQGDENEGGSEAEVSADESDDSEEDDSDQDEHEEENDDDESNEDDQKAGRRRSISSAPQMSPIEEASDELQSSDAEGEEVPPRHTTKSPPAWCAKPGASGSIAQTLSQTTPFEAGTIEPSLLSRLGPQSAAPKERSLFSRLGPQAAAPTEPSLLSRLGPQAVSVTKAASSFAIPSRSAIPAVALRRDGSSKSMGAVMERMISEVQADILNVSAGLQISP